MIELLSYIRMTFYYNVKEGGLYYFESKGPRKARSRAGSLSKSNGYRTVGIGGKGNQKQYREHRLIFLYHNGRLPKTIDHINGDRGDNRIENLRECTQQQNCMNTSSRKGSTSKYRGVRKLEENGKILWIAQVFHKGKNIHLGRFNKEDEAAMAYNIRAKECFSEYAKLNEI